MKWFFALNENSTGFDDYAEMLKVAVHTARRFTTLEPIFLYDGGDNELTAWCGENGVRIVPCRTQLYDRLKGVAERRNDPNFLTIGSGAFLRTEIPRLTGELGIDDEFVLYTDLDVMFLGDVVEPLSRMRPKYFAVAPEVMPRDYKHMNTGVMLMNVPALRERDAEFRKFMDENIDILVDKAWDQGAYQLFYKGRFFGYHWDKLPNEFNWKTYWDINADARIVHFHGPKPRQMAALTSENPPDYLVPLLHLVKPGYFEYSRRWEEFRLATLS